MQKSLLLLLLAAGFLHLELFAQKTVKMFNKAVAFVENKEYDSALVLFKKIYKKRAGSESITAKAHYNTGYVNLLKKDTPEVKKIFTEIMEEEYDEMDAGGSGSGIMAEPYALYKNNSSCILAGIYLAEKKYDSALYYTQLADKVYPYRHFCGNEYATNAIYMAVLYAKCYSGLGQTEKAINILFAFCIETGLANNSQLVQLLGDLLKTKYTQEIINKEVAAAIQQVHETSVTVNRTRYTVYETVLFGRRLRTDRYSEHIDHAKTAKLTGSSLAAYYFSQSAIVKELLKK
jgi:tetratricopeptide (TPR) repeat protein